MECFQTFWNSRAIVIIFRNRAALSNSSVNIHVPHNMVVELSANLFKATVCLVSEALGKFIK